MNTETDWKMVVAEIALRIRKTCPLIHHITNYVVMNDTANATLAIGASPVMAHAAEEVEELTSVAGALVLNPGTLSSAWIDSMLIAGRRANEIGIPIVYDPVGVGATKFRTNTGVRFLKELRLAVIRGNAGEVGALSGMGGAVRGVDSIESLQDPEKVALDLASCLHSIVVITGKRDIVSDGKRVIGVDNGHPMLPYITGSGCMVTAVIAAFCAVEKDFLLAAAAGLAYYGLSAEFAGQRASGPGSFRVALMDALYQLTPEQIKAGVRIVELK